MVINEDPLHLEVGSLAVLLVPELDESVLQTVAGLLVAYHLARKNLAESREDEFQIFVSRHRVELAHEQDLLRRCDLCEWQISDEFEGERLGTSLSFSSNLLQLLRIVVLFKGFVVRYADCCALFSRWQWTLWWLRDASWIVEGVIQYDCVQDPDILKWPAGLIDECVIDLLQSIKPFHNLPKDRGIAIELFHILPERDDELAAR